MALILKSILHLYMRCLGEQRFIRTDVDNLSLVIKHEQGLAIVYKLNLQQHKTLRMIIFMESPG